MWRCASGCESTDRDRQRPEFCADCANEIRDEERREYMDSRTEEDIIADHREAWGLPRVSR